MAFLCLRTLGFRAGLAPTSQLPLPGVRGLLTDPGVSLWRLCLSPTVEPLPLCGAGLGCAAGAVGVWEVRPARLVNILKG